jgi:hypothetical protein
MSKVSWENLHSVFLLYFFDMEVWHHIWYIRTKPNNMKKQLLLLGAACALVFSANAQNADADARIAKSDEPLKIKRVSSSQFKQSFASVQSGHCTPAPMCPQDVVYSGGTVRGYYFIAPTSFVICGLLVPTDASTGPQSIEVLRFHGTPPPAYPSVTNNFTSLIYVPSDTGTVTPVSCNLLINAGDTIGIYGARSTSTYCSYGLPSCTTTIMGYTVALNRTGMQYSLYDQQMHDVWSETGNDISRVIMYVDSVTTGVHVNDVNASLSVYPNPSKGIFTIEAKNKANGAMQAEVFNHLGERVYSAMLNESGRIDLSDKPEGVYFVQVKSAAGVLTKKIIVSR